MSHPAMYEPFALPDTVRRDPLRPPQVRRYLRWGGGENRYGEGRMDWWQAGTMTGTMVLAFASVAMLGWRVLRREFDAVQRQFEGVERQFEGVGQRFEAMRQESREAHEKIGERIDRLREGQAGLWEGQAGLREGQAGLREGLGEIRGELKGVRHTVQSLQEDFRAHVIRGDRH